ncbi:MAG: outer membrane beta-barrel protein [Bacteroidota bacterium]
MAKRAIFILVLSVLLSYGAFSQKADSIKVRRNHYSLTVGVGWAHYINTLEIGKDNATINSAGVSLKFFWEPEHRLSLGLESGFYRLYSVKSKSYTDVTGQATMSAMPFLLVVRMRIVDQFYLSAGAGLALMFNKVTGIDNKVNSNILSLSNYQFSGSYLYPLTKHWQVGGEFKVLNFGKASDWMYTIQALCAFRL